MYRSTSSKSKSVMANELATMHEFGFQGVMLRFLFRETQTWQLNPATQLW